MELSLHREEDAFSFMVRTLGAVAAMAGARGVVLGAREVAGTKPVPAVVDSEYRFYAAWYLVSGLTLLQGDNEPADALRKVRLLRVGLWTAAAGRVLSLRQTGRPSQGQLFLLGVEAALPVVLSRWQTRAAHSWADSAG
jgi:hypothetical protein